MDRSSQYLQSSTDPLFEENSHIFTREGLKVDTSSDQWVFPLSYRHGTINFSRISNELLKTAIKLRVIDQASRVSSHAGAQCWSDLSASVASRQEQFQLLPKISSEDFKERLISLMEDAIKEARKKHTLWALYRTIQWYIWCAENHPELGFSVIYAQELDSLEIPGNPKGEAVRQEDPESGPLHRTLELQPIINALKNDTSTNYEHLQQKAAVALSIAFGRNPANLTFLKESDFINLIADHQSPCYVLKIPRIKKRQLSPRDDLMDEYLEPEIAQHIISLINASKDMRLTIELDGELIEIQKPLFINHIKNDYAVKSKIWTDAFNMKSFDITNLIKGFIKRHNLISPLTGELMHVTTRRFRYTLATGLASEGISKRELARILDHTDTQHVQVYFEMAGKIVEHLDKAAAKGFSNYLNFFKGKLIDAPEEAINGDKEDKHLIFVNEVNPNDLSDIGVCGEASVCHLDPPYSCYLCPKFQPYRHANHEHVLECLLESREDRLQKYENARLGIQLDEVIAAVAQVVKLCEEEPKHV